MALYQNASIKDLQDILYGNCGFFEIDGRTTPVRFTPEQINFFRDNYPDRYNAALAVAGMYLEFTTDAEEISFEYSTTGSYVTNSGIDIYEDGELVLYTGKLEENAEAVKVSYKIKGPSPAHIKLYFPAGILFFPYNFCLGNAKPVPKKEKFTVFYGDSITQSAYIPTPSISFADIVADSLNAEYINRGVGSFVFDAGSLPDEPDCAPNYVFIEYGLNDLVQCKTLEDAYAAADGFLAKVKKLYPKAKTYVILPNFTHKDAEHPAIRSNLSTYCTALADIAAKHNLPTIDGKRLMPDMPIMFWEDMVHLSEAGSAVFAHNLVKYMK